MKKLLMLSACIFVSYAMQAQCGGCPHHKQQTGCAKTTQTLKSDSTKATKAVPADGRSKISTQNASAKPTTIVKENPKTVESNAKALPAQKATIREDENTKKNSAR